MNHHTVTILQKNYSIACPETEVQHLQECTNFVNDVLKKIVKNCKTASETTLMAMALLTITDELLDYKKNTQIPSISEDTIPNNLLSKLENLRQKMEEHV